MLNRSVKDWVGRNIHSRIGLLHQQMLSVNKENEVLRSDKNALQNKVAGFQQSQQIMTRRCRDLETEKTEAKRKQEDVEYLHQQMIQMEKEKQKLNAEVEHLKQNIYSKDQCHSKEIQLLDRQIQGDFSLLQFNAFFKFIHRACYLIHLHNSPN